MPLSLATLSALVNNAEVVNDTVGKSNLMTIETFDNRWKTMTQQQRGQFLQAVDRFVLNAKALATVELPIG